MVPVRPPMGDRVKSLVLVMELKILFDVQILKSSQNYMVNIWPRIGWICFQVFSVDSPPNDCYCFQIKLIPLSHKITAEL